MRKDSLTSRSSGWQICAGVCSVQHIESLIGFDHGFCFSSTARAIRHTSTFALQAIMHQMSIVLNELFANGDTFEKLLEAETSKGANDAKTVQLEENLSKINSNAEHIESLLVWMFKTYRTLEYSASVLTSGITGCLQTGTGTRSSLSVIM